MFNILFKRKCLNNLFFLPESAKKRFQKVLDILENDPKDRRYTVQIHGCPNLRRIKVTRKYRLFYLCDQNCLKLLEIVKRDKDIYKPKFIKGLSEEDIPPIFDANDDIEEQKEEFF